MAKFTKPLLLLTTLISGTLLANEQAPQTSHTENVKRKGQQQHDRHVEQVKSFVVIEEIIVIDDAKVKRKGEQQHLRQLHSAKGTASHTPKVVE
ncbi:MAG: hypothetical protein ACRCT7_08100 [Shewanella sp.]